MKIAGVQMDVALGQVAANLQTISEQVRETAAAGAVLTVFPECALTGYCFDSWDEAAAHAEPIPGPSTERLAAICGETGSFAVMGMLEIENKRLYNAAVLVGPQGVVGSYRKVHLPFLGVDRFVAYGDRPFAAHDVGNLRVGMNICYDASFPEAARCLALSGADVIALPTNWPPGSECAAASLVNARALENGLYYIAVNRVGVENGFPFIGHSRIADPTGATLDAAAHDQPAVLYAEIDVARARNKHYIRVPEKHEIDRFADRRPELYEPIVARHDLQPPGRGGATDVDKT